MAGAADGGGQGGGREIVSSQDRHVGQRTIDEYVTAGVAAVIPIPGDPKVELVIDPPGETLCLEVAWDGNDPVPIQEYLHFATDVRTRNGRSWATLSVLGRRFFAEAYPLLRSVADRVQLQDCLMGEAVRRSLADYHELLAAAAPMPPHLETGLFGELLVLGHLVSTMGGAAAMAAWRGGDQTEEHDFGLPDGDVEVKSTIGEDRRHMIGSLSQLQATAGRPLWLLSVQVTGAGAGEGRRLPDLVDEIAASLPQALSEELRSRVETAGYRPNQRHSTYRLLRPRSIPALYAVDEAFPRIVLGTLVAGGAHIGRIGEVSYSIKLDGLPTAATRPAALTDLTRSTRWTH